MTLAHRVAVMNRGIVQQIATPRQIYDDPANLFVAGFIGSPPMNFLEGELVDGAFACPAGRFATAVAGSREPRHRRPAGRRTAASRPGDGKIAAQVYALELMGDHTLVTCQAGDATADRQGRQGRRPRDGRADRHRLLRARGLPVRHRQRRTHPQGRRALRIGSLRRPAYAPSMGCKARIHLGHRQRRKITHTISICVPYAVHTAKMKPFQSLARNLRRRCPEPCIRPRRGQRRDRGRPRSGRPDSGPGRDGSTGALLPEVSCSVLHRGFHADPRRCAVSRFPVEIPGLAPIRRRPAPSSGSRRSAAPAGRSPRR